MKKMGLKCFSLQNRLFDHKNLQGKKPSLLGKTSRIHWLVNHARKLVDQLDVDHGTMVGSAGDSLLTAQSKYRPGGGTPEGILRIPRRPGRTPPGCRRRSAARSPFPRGPRHPPGSGQRCPGRGPEGGGSGRDGWSPSPLFCPFSGAKRAREVPERSPKPRCSVGVPGCPSPCQVWRMMEPHVGPLWGEGGACGRTFGGWSASACRSGPPCVRARVGRVGVP